MDGLPWSLASLCCRCISVCLMPEKAYKIDMGKYFTENRDEDQYLLNEFFFAFLYMEDF